MFAHLRNTDVVWDIGANVGFYTRRFAKRVETAGSVLAIEPHPRTFAELNRAMDGHHYVRVLNMALGERTGSAQLIEGQDTLRATSSLSLSRSATPRDAREDLVPVRAGGEVIEVLGQDWFPNVMKIDVEGFEEAVLAGFREELADTRLRAIFCEVHFSLLAANGRRYAPLRMQRLLRQKGFGVVWCDPSHLIAARSEL